MKLQYLAIAVIVTWVLTVTYLVTSNTPPERGPASNPIQDSEALEHDIQKPQEFQPGYDLR